MKTGERRALKVFDRKKPKDQPDDELRNKYNADRWADANREHDAHEKIKYLEHVITSYGIEKDQDDDIVIV